MPNAPSTLRVASIAISPSRLRLSRASADVVGNQLGPMYEVAHLGCVGARGDHRYQSRLAHELQQALTTAHPHGLEVFRFVGVLLRVVRLAKATPDGGKPILLFLVPAGGPTRT